MGLVGFPILYSGFSFLFLIIFLVLFLILTLTSFLGIWGILLLLVALLICASIVYYRMNKGLDVPGQNPRGRFIIFVNALERISEPELRVESLGEEWINQDKSVDSSKSLRAVYKIKNGIEILDENDNRMDAARAMAIFRRIDNLAREYLF